MKEAYILPVWAPRVKPFLIRRLYEGDAQGLLDPDLLDEVGWALYSRCDSFLLAAEANRGRLRCPVCQAPVLREAQPKEKLHCTACGWECTFQAYLKTFKNQQLDGGPEVAALFREYTQKFPKGEDPAAKMLLIDGLIHGFHHFLRSGRTRRPVGINLISGHLEFVVDFLDHLSVGPGSTSGVQETQAAWREKIHPASSKKNKAKKKPAGIDVG